MQKFYPAINLTSKKSFVNTFKIFFLTVMLFSTSALLSQVTPGPYDKTCDRKPISNGQTQNFINTISLEREKERIKSIVPQAQRNNSNRSVLTQGVSGLVSTESVFLTGNLSVTDPTFNRTVSMDQGGTCGQSGVGTATHYKTHSFTLTAASAVTVSLLTSDGGSITPGSADSFLGLYGPGGFVPAASCTNLIAANDDAASGGLISQIVTTPLPAGTYTAVVTSFDNTPVDFPWNYSLAILFTVPAVCTSGNIITDGSFETSNPSTAANASWPSTSTNFGTSICSAGLCGSIASASPRTGTFWTWFGGIAAAEIGTVQQSVVIPVTGTAFLNYYLRIGAVSAPFNATMKVTVDGITQTTYTEPSVAEAAYSLRTLNLSAFADGNIHIIKFEYNNPAGSGTSNFSVDDVSLDLTPIVVTTQPVNVTICAGSNAIFSIATAGAVSSYQWQINSGSGFTNINNGGVFDNATTATLNIASVPVSFNATQYRVVVTGPCGTVTSNAATLTVSQTLHSNVVATPSVVCSPGVTVITATASGTSSGNYTHTLTGAGTIVQNASTGTKNENASFSISAIPAGSQTYALTSMGTEGCPVVTNITITVNAAPVITFTQTPVNPICNGQIQQITASVAPSVTVTYSPITNLFTNAAATTAYTGTPVTGSIYAKPAATTVYTATAVANSCTTTATVTVTVNQLPAITVQPTPSAQTVCPGTPVIYSVTATGTALTYQWRKGGVNLVNGLQASGGTVAGATSNTLTLTGTAIGDAGSYDVVINGACTPAVTSTAAILTVVSTPTITTQPANAPTCLGGTATFSVVAAGTPAPTLFQWQVSTTAVPAFTNIVGGNTATLAIPNVTAAMDGNKYRVIITNSCGQSVTSDGAATLKINAVTTPTINAIPATICLSDGPVLLAGSPVGGSFSGIGVSGFNFIPATTAVGNYTLTYSYSNALGCVGTSTVIAKVSDCPERLRLLRDKAVIVYPIPNNGNFSFRVNSTLYSYLNLRVYNTSGGLLSTRNYSGLVYGQVVPVDLTNLPSGSYMLRFFYDDGARTSEKVIPIVIMHN